MEWINLRLECYRGQSWRSDASSYEESKSSSGIPDTERRSCNIEIFWRLKDVKDARAMGYMLRKAANREWNQPRRKQFVAINKDKKGVEI